MRATQDLAKLVCVITSGSLFDLKVWHNLGGFSADLFLDLVDTDYCLRARRAGHDIAASHAAHLLHHRGEKRPVRLLGCTFYPSHTPLFRLRCLSRNRILLFRRHRFYPPAWIAYELAYAVKLVIDALLFEQHTCSRLMAIVRGTWEGVMGRSGPVRTTGK
jgi:rhamnosyltransferase